MSNYEVLSGENTATIYSLQSLITPVPKPEDDPIYKGRYKAGSSKDGQYLAWKGLSEYDFESQRSVRARDMFFGIVEDVSELKTNGIVNMLLYHGCEQ